MPVAPAIISRYDLEQIRGLLTTAAAGSSATAARAPWRRALREAIVVGDHARLPGGIVAIGSRLFLHDLDTGARMEARLVTATNGAAGSDQIPVISPLGRAVLGRAEGDCIECRAGDRMRRFQITRVHRNPVAIAAAAM